MFLKLLTQESNMDVSLPSSVIRDTLVSSIYLSVKMPSIRRYILYLGIYTYYLYSAEEA